MQYRKLGRTGLDVGIVGLGTEYLLHQPRDAMAAVVGRAVAAGVNYVDLLYSHAGFLQDFAPALRGVRDRARFQIVLVPAGRSAIVRVAFHLAHKGRRAW